MLFRSFQSLLPGARWGGLLNSFSMKRAQFLPSLQGPNGVGNGLLRSSFPTFEGTGVQQQVRWKTMGNEYQPSNRKRKRKFGFLARIRSASGRKILRNRRKKGRMYLTH
ncbi:ribosomal protein subunit L34 [Schizosaccharomyces octosporus yFS286]|uniref:Large ribosomal subunit protein bL34m n=1 Tax=Schizosaccharomyces octosporus (strain yFS286) TaxID=483514 RepID=S9RAL3_SCHOY|nr:ribosomal protein subunit L34 [Schizosaccharomyces octosporus yFS286]EPX71149.1 ribosomal protein subunit L34 [Schizosaccharomyces octosporus yFS286]